MDSVKTMELWDATVKCGDGKIHNMLVGEKISLVTFATVVGPVFFGVTLVNLINRADVYMRGGNPENHGLKKKEHVFEYIP